MNEQLEIVLNSDKKATEMMEKAHADALNIKEKTKSKIQFILEEAKKKVDKKRTAAFDDAEEKIKVEKTVFQQNKNRQVEEFEEKLKKEYKVLYKLIEKKIL